MCRWLSGIPRTSNCWKTCPLLILRATLTQRYPEKPERLMWSSLEGKVECWETVWPPKGCKDNSNPTFAFSRTIKKGVQTKFTVTGSSPNWFSVLTSSQIIPKLFLFKSWKTFILRLHALPLVTLCTCVRDPSHPAPPPQLFSLRLNHQ